MGLTMLQIAESFSSHKFDATYEYLLDDVHWNIVGRPAIIGKEDVIRTCEESAEHLATVSTEFSKFRTVKEGDCVVVDTLAEYTDAENSTSTVASCDIYDFRGGSLSAITSYNVELS